MSQPEDVPKSLQLVKLDYAVTPRPRWGHGRPVHRELEAVIGVGIERYRANLQTIVGHHAQFAKIPVSAPLDEFSPYWNNRWFEGIDGQSVYAFVASLNPPRYWEVGSGNSTKFAARAIADHGLTTKITSIDPFPRAEIDQLCATVIRQPLEDCDVGMFGELTVGDILLIDNSHRVFMNSDCAVFFLEILPRLAPGVLVGIHDIFLPADYPPHWGERFYSEQYLLAAYLLAKGTRLRIELPSQFVFMRPELRSLLQPLHADPALINMQPAGSTFWFSVT